MRPDLLDAEAAINWAVAQLPVLEERIATWRGSKPYAVRIDTDTEPGKKLYRLCNIRPLDPIINAEAGAIIHSIRSSLDLLACALAARNGFPDSTSTYFPFWESEDEFVTNRDPRPLKKIKRLSQVCQDIIKSLKPYPGPNGNALLCALHDLDLTRKHRRLLDTFIFPRGIGFNPGLSGQVTMADWRGFNEETVLCSTGPDAPDSDVTIGLNVAFDEAGPMHGQNFTASIRDFARMAGNILTLFCPTST